MYSSPTFCFSVMSSPCLTYASVNVATGLIPEKHFPVVASRPEGISKEIKLCRFEKKLKTFVEIDLKNYMVIRWRSQSLRILLFYIEFLELL